jgi:hypothetical protein
MPCRSLPLTVAGGPNEAALLLLAGGTGVTGWLPALARCHPRRRCHLVWCVQTTADYLALAERLPGIEAPCTQCLRHGDPLTLYCACGWGGPAAARSGGRTGVSVTVFVTRGTATDLASVAAVELSTRQALVAEPLGAERPLSQAIQDDSQSYAAELPSAPRSQSGGSGGESKSSTAIALVSLAAALVGVLVSYRGYAFRNPVPGQTIGGYAMGRRCLPVVLVVASMAVTVALGCMCTRWLSGSAPMHRHSKKELLLLPNNPVHTAADSLSIPPAQVWEWGAKPPAQAPHKLQAGRPDLGALVRTAARELVGTRRRRLVVAACGPEQLVRAWNRHDKNRGGD